jgi:hypothetical protein
VKHKGFGTGLVVDLLQVFLTPIIFTVVLSQQGLLILNPVGAFINPNRNALPGESWLSVDVKALDIDKAILVDRAGKLHIPKQLTSSLRLDNLAAHPIQHLSWRSSTVWPLLMSPVGGGVESGQ